MVFWDFLVKLIILEKTTGLAQDKSFIGVVIKSIRKGLTEITLLNKTFSYWFSILEYFKMILNDVLEDSIMKTMLLM